MFFNTFFKLFITGVRNFAVGQMLIIDSSMTLFSAPQRATMQDEVVKGEELQLCCSSFCAQGPKARAPPPLLSTEEISPSLDFLSYSILVMLLFMYTHQNFWWLLSCYIFWFSYLLIRQLSLSSYSACSALTLL